MVILPVDEVDRGLAVLLTCPRKLMKRLERVYSRGRCSYLSETGGGTGCPQAVARVERDCSDYHLLLKGGCRSQRMELRRTMKAEKINHLH